MNHVEQFRRSINIWKLTDYEKTDIYVDMYLWMDIIFKDLEKFTSDKYPLRTFYGKSKKDIILEQDLKNDCNYIHYDKVYSVFDTRYRGYVSDYEDIMSIFHEYLGNILELKGSHSICTLINPRLELGNILELKGSHSNCIFE